MRQGATGGSGGAWVLGTPFTTMVLQGGELPFSNRLHYFVVSNLTSTGFPKQPMPEESNMQPRLGINFQKYDIKFYLSNQKKEFKIS